MSGAFAAVADFDEDGAPDVVVGASDIFVAAFSGNGRGGFSQPSVFEADGIPREIAIGDYDEDGHVDVAIVNAGEGTLAILLNRTLERERFSCRAGNVNGASGPVTDVLFVNGSAGSGASRRIQVDPLAPFEIRVDAPPALPAGPSPCAIWAYLGQPDDDSPTALPMGVGTVCMPPPFASPPRLKAIWNSIGHWNVLGQPTLPSSPAPSVLLSRPGGIGRRIDAFIQGVILDSASPSGLAAVTNGVYVDSR
jgi:hypothetical protein